MNEIKYENVFIDGTKIEGNANRYSFVWKKATTKFEDKLKEKMKSTLSNLNLDFEFKIEVQFLKEVYQKLTNLKQINNIEFVYGKGRYKSKLQNIWSY